MLNLKKSPSILSIIIFLLFCRILSTYITPSLPLPQPPPFLPVDQHTTDVGCHKNNSIISRAFKITAFKTSEQHNMRSDQKQ
jgi:hypothetical protein